jgi:hypothetical protein
LTSKKSLSDFEKKASRSGDQMTKTLGFIPKQRTKEEINQEYNQHAVMYGHEACMIEEAQEHVEKIFKSQEQRVRAMVNLRQEAAKLPVEPAAPKLDIQAEEGPTGA